MDHASCGGTSEVAALEDLILETFVARSDVYARQDLNGGYMPVYQPLDANTVARHLRREISVGHYLATGEGITKVVALDIDLEPHGVWMQYPEPDEYPMDLGGAELDQWMSTRVTVHPARPRLDWRDRSHPGRAWYKQLLRTAAEYLASAMERELGIPTLITYSGHKGVHVYGLTSGVHVSEAKAGAELTLHSAGRHFGAEFEPLRGNNFYQLAGGPPWAQSFAVETFPKQDTMEGKKLGNLMRLPLGGHLKSPMDPTFFVDRATAYTHLDPHPDPAALLQDAIARRTA